MKDNTKKTFKIYLKASLKYKKFCVFILVSIILASVVGVITPLYIKQFFDSLTSGAKEALIVEKLLHILAIIIILNIIGWIFWRMASFATTYFEARVIADLDNQSFQYLHQHSFSFFNSNFVGSLLKRVKWFSRSFEVIADQITWEITPLAVNIGVIVFILLKRNYLLGLGILIWTGLFLVINFIFTKYKFKYNLEKANKETETAAFLADTIANSSNVRFFNGFQREVKGFAKLTEALRNIRIFAWNLDNAFEAFQGVLTISLEAGMIYLGIRLWQKEIITVGDFVLIQYYVINIINRVWHFGRMIRRIYEGLADAEEMTIVLNTPHEIQDIIKAKKLIATKGVIEFKGVDFCYHKTRKVLADFNLIIKSKEKVALVGYSGSGKTTIIKLLLRMHETDKGEILIDGQNIAKTTQESLRENIGLVPQDSILFHRTIMENIRYGKPEASDKEVVLAAKKANCHDFIAVLPEGYNSYVGERGVKLSGGERQRVAIARAILRNAPILVLDEATSSLDSQSENLIQEAMEKLMENKTVIVIAHRLSTIRRMDRIIVVKKGGVVEQGTHQQLINKRNGKYRKLWKMQVGSFIE